MNEFLNLPFLTEHLKYLTINDISAFFILIY